MTVEIRVGIGGWTFEPWRDNFYPKGLPQKQELHFASRQVTAIEINGTYYGAQKPESFARWHDEAPEDFVFALIRRLDHPLPVQRAGRAEGEARPDQLAVPADQDLRAGGFRSLPSVAAEDTGWRGAAPCGGGAAPQLLRAGIPRDAAPPRHRRGGCG